MLPNELGWSDFSHASELCREKSIANERPDGQRNEERTVRYVDIEPEKVKVPHFSSIDWANVSIIQRQVHPIKKVVQKVTDDVSINESDRARRPTGSSKQVPWWQRCQRGRSSARSIGFESILNNSNRTVASLIIMTSCVLSIGAADRDQTSYLCHDEW